MSQRTATENTKAKAPPKDTVTATKAPLKAAKKALAKATRKRKADGEDEDEDEDEVQAKAFPPKRTRVVEQPKAPRQPKPPVIKPKVVINHGPTQRLDIFVFGEGSSSELGLGTAKNASHVKRPRLNPLLSAKDVGVVQIATGGMHVAALTHDNKILTWGVNDSGALGRNTQWEGSLKNINIDRINKDSDDSDKSENDMNPNESNPAQVPAEDFPEGTTFVKVSAGDSHTLALTDGGLVYGWGVFRKTDGPFGFLPGEKSAKEEHKPVPLSNLKNITDICSGANHVLALDDKGTIYAWGCGEQNQLGYRIVQRTGTEGPKNNLKPQPLRMKAKRKYKAIYAGNDHAFAIDENDHVWAWGVNNFGGTGILEGAGDDNAVVYFPQIVESLTLENDSITHITGGQHHSVAITATGKALAWGRVDGFQVGLNMSTVPRTSTIQDEKDTPRIVIVPTALSDIGKATWASAGTDHTIVLNDKGEALSWGFSATYQTGQGTTKDVAVPTRIDNTAVRGKKLNWAGCGGQYSILTAPAKVEVMVNGDYDNGDDGPSGS